MDRREFLKISAAASIAVAASSCAGGSKGKESQGAPEGSVAQNFPGVGLLGYGCMRWPVVKDAEGKDHIDQEAVNQMVDEALAHGVNYFDASPVYLQGDCERATAEALGRHPREKWLLATKLSNFSAWDYDNSVAMYSKSLEIFNTDHIDYYLLHSVGGKEAFDKRFGGTDIMKFLLKEREEGHIRNLGFSFHGSADGLREMLELHEQYHWDFCQIQMNYLDWRHASGRNGNAEELYALLSEKEIPVVIMEPLRGGSLSNIPAPQAERLKAFEPDRSVASWAFRFAGSFPKVLTVLSGMSCMEHLQDNLRTFCDFKALVEEEFELLESVAAEIDKYPLIRCTGCQYCMPCPYGIDIPGVFSFYNRTINEDTYVKMEEQKNYARARRRFLALYDRSVETARQADHCISCGKCVKACPQRIRIPGELAKIDKYIENLKRCPENTQS